MAGGRGLTQAREHVVVLERLRAMGVTLALDDFGIGHSSLSNLKALPVHELKIDRSFVMAMRSDPRDAAIVRATLALARAVDLLVVAEGIEELEVYADLAMAGCDRGQGFFLSRPVPAPELLAWARAWRAAEAPGAPDGQASAPSWR